MKKISNALLALKCHKVQLSCISRLQNVKMISRQWIWEPLFDAFWRINFRSYVRIELLRKHAGISNCTRRRDNGRRKYYISPESSLSDLNFLSSAVSAVYWKSSARVRRQSSQSARSAASNRSDKSKAESHLRSACEKSWRSRLSLSFLILRKST